MPALRKDAQIHMLFSCMAWDMPSKPYPFTGDSAGGGLALVLRQMLNNSPAGNPAGEITHYAVPDRMVLYSPWLDISLSNLDSRNYHTRREALLPLSDLRKSGKRYAGGLCLLDPRCSPLLGPAFEQENNFRQIATFCGLPNSRH